MSSSGTGPLSIIFFGTAELAAYSLRALLQAPGFQVTHVVTQPDKPKGRDLKLAFPAVKEVALAAGLPVLQPLRARAPEFIDQIRAFSPELLVVAAYGQILPQALLDIPKHGSLNVHASLLPKHRGAAPIQWSLIEGDRETGVTIMKMDAGLDTGPMLSRRSTPISESDTGQTLHDRLAQVGADLLIETIPDWVTGKIVPQPQPEGATYARKITREDGQINWTESAELISRKLRAFTPWPGGFTWLPGTPPRLLKIWAAKPVPGISGEAGVVVKSDHELVIACGVGALAPQTLQREGGKRLATREFLAGNPIAPGTRLLANPASKS